MRDFHVLPDWPYTKTVAGYTVRQALQAGDLESIRLLRNQVFEQQSPEVLEKMKRLDSVSQHILVETQMEKQETKQIVGCYRLTCSIFSDDFDSADCFELKDLLSKPGNQLELSYACVHPDHRHGPVIRLLLAAIKDYCQTYQCQTVFGCASLKTTDQERALRAYDILTLREPCQKKTKVLAPLLRFYFQLGAIVLAPPFFDQDFSCFDFFMMLDLSSIPEDIWTRFL